MAENGDTSIRVSKAAKKRLRKVVRDRGMPDSVSDDDAVRLLCDWVESLIPAKHNGA